MRKYRTLFLRLIAVIIAVMYLIPTEITSAKEQDDKKNYEFTSDNELTILNDEFGYKDAKSIQTKLDHVTSLTVEAASFYFDILEYFPRVEAISISKHTTRIMIDVYSDSMASALKEINVDQENPSYQSEAGVLYTKQLHKLLYYPNAAAKKVVVPKETKIIGSKAFMNVPITSVTLPDGLGMIESDAFKNTKLTEISLPKSLAVIESDAFDHTPLKKIKVDSENKTLCSIDGIIYSKDQKHLYYWPDGKVVENLELPENLVYLDCSKIPTFSNIQTLTIHKNLTAIVNTEGNQLHTIKLAKENPYFTLYDGVLYSSNGNMIRLYPNRNTDTEIEINPKLESFPMNLFYEDNTTTSLILPSGLKKFIGSLWVEDVLLGGFNHLKELKFAEANPNFTLKDGVLYNKTMTSIVWYPTDLDTKSYVMPSTITSIANDQLIKQNHLEKLTVAKNCLLYDSSRKSTAYAQYYYMPVGSQCSNLKQFGVARNSKYYTVKDGVLFSKDGTELLAYPCAKVDKTYEIPSNVVIAPFGNKNPYLETLIVPSKVIVLASKEAVVSGEGFWDGLLDYTALKEIKVDKDNEYYTSIDGVLYEKNEDILNLIVYPLGKENETYELPDMTKSITAVNYLKDHPYLKQMEIKRRVKGLDDRDIRIENGNLQFWMYDIDYDLPNIQVILTGKEKK